MEQKLNIAEILKNKPRGTKLYSMIHGKCSSEAVTDEIFKINFCTSKFGLTQSGECCVTCLVKFKNESTELCVYFRNPEGWVCDDMSPKDFKRNFKGWLYIDDLLPKKGD